LRANSERRPDEGPQPVEALDHASKPDLDGWRRTSGALQSENVLKWAMMCY